MDDVTTRAIESIVKQFRGGEHALAGRRASELVYGKGTKLDAGFLAKLQEDAPGIERYIAAPGDPQAPAEDQSGNPLATQPENDPQQNIASNVSTDEARAEQNEIDDRLATGRKKAEEASGDQDLGNQATGSTQMNPTASDKDDRQPEREKAASKSKTKKPGA